MCLLFSSVSLSSLFLSLSSLSLSLFLSLSLSISLSLSLSLYQKYLITHFILLQDREEEKTAGARSLIPPIPVHLLFLNKVIHPIISGTYFCVGCLSISIYIYTYIYIHILHILYICAAFDTINTVTFYTQLSLFLHYSGH